MAMIARQIYLEPLREQKILTEDQIKLIFPQVCYTLSFTLHILTMMRQFDIILNFNCALLAELKVKMADWSENSSLADIFLKMVLLHHSLCLAVVSSMILKSDFLKTYSAFVSNYQSGLQLINTWANSNPTFAQFLQVCLSMSVMISDVMMSLGDERCDGRGDFVTQDAMDDPRANNLDLPSFLIMPIQRIPRVCTHYFSTTSPHYC